MSERKFIFRGGSRELVLPVTPESYRVETGINVEVINIHALGDVILTGYGTLATIKISCMLPSNDYSFARDDDPDQYIEKFESWCQKATKLRFIIGNTGVNVPVIVENISYGEQDGTNDVYADITLREYKKLAAVRTVTTKVSASAPRAPMEKSPAALPQNYVVQQGETAQSVMRKMTGSVKKAGEIIGAATTGLRNASMLAAGAVLNITKVLGNKK